MTQRCRSGLVGLIVLAVLSHVLGFGIAAVVAEGALHPLLRRRGTDTASLAYKIAQAANVKAAKVVIRGSDGSSLTAWWLAQTHTDRGAVMICHGVADSAYGALGYSLFFLRDGYSVLVPESRGHGESGGYVTYGILEADDTIQWLHWMKSQGVTSAFGLGESLGGAILIQSLARGADFQALVVECSYSSFEAVAKERVARIIPAVAAELLVKEALLYTRIRHGVDLYNARPDLDIRCARVPILLIHGLADNETNPDHSQRLARENPAFTKLWLIPGAKHTRAYGLNPEAFQKQVLHWFHTLGETVMETDNLIGTRISAR